VCGDGPWDVISMKRAVQLVEVKDFDDHTFHPSLFSSAAAAVPFIVPCLPPQSVGKGEELW
jgi:hypothetical protein